jgi:CheY-like chemotaxis protein
LHQVLLVLKHIGKRVLNILVVDDNAMNQSLMKHLLTQWEVGFDIASNGEEAINRLKSEHL